jgi:hypothetical protein
VIPDRKPKPLLSKGSTIILQTNQIQRITPNENLAAQLKKTRRIFQNQVTSTNPQNALSHLNPVKDQSECKEKGSLSSRANLQSAAPGYPMIHHQEVMTKRRKSNLLQLPANILLGQGSPPNMANKGSSISRNQSQ